MMFGVIRLARYRKKRMISREFHLDGLIYINRYYSRMNMVFNMSESYKRARKSTIDITSILEYIVCQDKLILLIQMNQSFFVRLEGNANNLMYWHDS